MEANRKNLADADHDGGFGDRLWWVNSLVERRSVYQNETNADLSYFCGNFGIRIAARAVLSPIGDARRAADAG